MIDPKRLIVFSFAAAAGWVLLLDNRNRAPAFQERDGRSPAGRRDEGFRMDAHAL
ncbi:hypothetical protein [Methylobacterium flocculans]|uniref:hypothetical protein n=1 Tax=Methylobacterium flocculans TaxID=2984843 RepID=UPI0021F3927B|nr:hypothetical protein [Methylobacterium sp. FF17]